MRHALPAAILLSFLAGFVIHAAVERCSQKPRGGWRHDGRHCHISSPLTAQWQLQDLATFAV